MADKTKTIVVGGMELPAGARPQNRVQVKNKNTGEVQYWYPIDWRAYKGKDWIAVRNLTGDEVASKVKTVNIDPEPSDTGAAPEDGDATPNDPWASWSDDQIRKAAEEAGVPKPEKKTRQRLIADLAKHGVEPTDDKPAA